MIDVYSRRIVGWKAARSMHAALVIDAMNMAAWTRRNTDLDGVICHSDAGSQYTSIAYTDRLDEIGAAPSIGTMGDSYDNAMAETTIGLFKTELHRNPAAIARNGGPWRGLDDLEIAVCAWVSWFNTDRLHSQLGDRTPDEFENDCTRLRVLRVYDRNNQKSAIQFIYYVLAKLPFQTECVQTDNGAEFQGAFHWHLLDRGIQHVYIRPRTPRLNGKVERSHRIDNEEFYRLLDGVVIDDSGLFQEKLQEWEDFYNFHRPHGALGGQTPYERLLQRTKQPTPTA